MLDVVEKISARTAPTQFLALEDRLLAYRRFGEGPPLLLMLRFRGVMDSWDPAFLDALAERFTVIVFDYTGLGRSSGTPTYDKPSMARDARDVIDGLGLDRVALAGWSIGGIAAQVFAAEHPDRVSHLILIGTSPPGRQPHGPEPIFLQTALKPVNTLEDEYILFFEPTSAASRAAADASHRRIAERVGDISPPVPEATFLQLLRDQRHLDGAFPDADGRYAEFMATTGIPILAINGDHDVVFPVENWYALNRRWRSLRLLTLPQAGHGPQHQEPQFCAATIADFVQEIGI